MTVLYSLYLVMCKNRHIICASDERRAREYEDLSHSPHSVHAGKPLVSNLPPLNVSMWIFITASVASVPLGTTAPVPHSLSILFELVTLISPRSLQP
jgi:hypothetical protein